MQSKDTKCTLLHKFETVNTGYENKTFLPFLKLNCLTSLIFAGVRFGSMEFLINLLFLNVRFCSEVPLSIVASVSLLEATGLAVFSTHRRRKP